MQTDCVILGGGAGGPVRRRCALGRRTALRWRERLPRVGKKLLATETAATTRPIWICRPSHYGKAAPVEKMYAATPPRRWPPSSPHRPDDRRGGWPRLSRTMAASAVLDVLRMACERHAVSMLTDTEVALTPSRRGGWSVQWMVRDFLRRTSSPPWAGKRRAVDGHGRDGRRLMQSLGHEITPLYPALVQLRCSHPALKGAEGHPHAGRIDPDD